MAEYERDVDRLIRYSINTNGATPAESIIAFKGAIRKIEENQKEYGIEDKRSWYGPGGRYEKFAKQFPQLITNGRLCCTETESFRHGCYKIEDIKNNCIDKQRIQDSFRTVSQYLEIYFPEHAEQIMRQIQIICNIYT